MKTGGRGSNKGLVKYPRIAARCSGPHKPKVETSSHNVANHSMTRHGMAWHTAKHSAAQEEAFETFTNGGHTAVSVQQQHICTKLEESMQAMILHASLQWIWQSSESWNMLPYAALLCFCRQAYIAQTTCAAWQRLVTIRCIVQSQGQE